MFEPISVLKLSELLDPAAAPPAVDWSRKFAELLSMLLVSPILVSSNRKFVELGVFEADTGAPNNTSNASTPLSFHAPFVRLIVGILSQKAGRICKR